MYENQLIREVDPNFEAFAELYRRNITRVYRYYMVHVGNTHAAEDLTSRTFLAALKEFPSFQKTDGFTVRILEIAVEKCLRDPRWSRREFHDDTVLYYQVSSLATDKSAMQRMELESVSRALKQIPSSRAEAITLHFFGDLSNSEISAVLKENIDTIEALAPRGLEDLRAATSQWASMETISDHYEEQAFRNKLSSLAAQITPDPHFESELERVLATNYQPKTKWTLPLQQFFTIIGWVVLIGATFFLLNWRDSAYSPNTHQATARPTTQAVTKTTTGEVTSTHLHPTARPTATEIPLQDYTVQAGDTCTYIANQFGLTIDLLITINHLNNTCDIWADQKLKVPITPISTPSS
jgi:RNA polymerase sigma-70 factor (ECF subfamily)